MTLEGRAQQTIKEMEKQGRVTTLSQEATYRINNEIGEAFEKIRNITLRKLRASYYYALANESGLIEHKENYFTKIINYFSNLFNPQTQHYQNS